MTDRNHDDLQKWAFLAQVPYRDAEALEIRRRAAGLMQAAGDCPRCFAHLALALARDCVAFVRDTQRTGGEDIAGYTREPTEQDATEALARGRDDCDAKARLFVALCLAAGLSARMVPLWKGGALSHVSAEVWLDGVWQPAETTLARARLGESPDRIPKESNTGRWRRS